MLLEMFLDLWGAHDCFSKISEIISKMNFCLPIRADFQQGMESVSEFKMNTVTENYCLILCSSNGNMTLSCEVLFSVIELI